VEFYTYAGEKFTREGWVDFAVTRVGEYMREFPVYEMGACQGI
jgi:hypothetical protein